MQVVPTLAAAMDLAVQHAQTLLAREEGRHPWALLWTDDGALSVAALATENLRSSQIALAQLVARDDVALVVQYWEAWVARYDEQPDDPDIQRLARHEIQVQDLPPEKRRDGLMVLGEARDGSRATRKFDIVGSCATGRTFVEQDLSDVVSLRGVATRSVFLFRRLMEQTGCTEREARAWLQQLARKEEKA
jgi:hypothetical protein